MELIFSYEVETIDTKVNIGSVRFNEFLTDEAAERLKKSYEKGFVYINDDAEISDIFDAIYESTIEIEKEQGYYYLLGTEVKLTEFLYPEEIRNKDNQ